jgi:predicted nucleic acid-binding protein
MNCMSDRCFVDTNVLVYAHDRDSVGKCERARSLTQELWEGGNGALSTQVLQELYLSLRKKVIRPLSSLAAEQTLRDYFAWYLVINTPASILRAVELESRYQVSFWDALILQAAEVAQAEILYSEDLNHRQMYGSVRVVNPFLS